MVQDRALTPAREPWPMADPLSESPMTPATMRLLRQVHTYLGVFFAPAIIFLAFTGALQTFSLHENKGGGPYTPPAWIVTLASIHKDQTLPKPARQHPPSAAPAEKAKPDHAAGPDQPAGAPAPDKRPSPLPLKIFVLFVAIGLITSSLIGLYIALTNKALRRTASIVLAAGVVAPLLLLWI
jgi:hypothetical protein